jgi:hypothetical protein
VYQSRVTTDILSANVQFAIDLFELQELQSYFGADGVNGVFGGL